jgi:predicted phosphodiesterase
MKDKTYGIVSDVHGNQEAFSSTLAYLTGLGVNEIYCLGDLVGYGQGAAECVELVRKYNVRCIQGNHDAQIRPPRDPRMREEAQIALDIAMKQLTPEQMQWLQNLKHERVVDNRMVLVHGALTGRDDYILNNEAIKVNMRILAEKYAGLNLCFFGHSHVSMVLGSGETRVNIGESDIIDLNPGKRYLINPGSVGQPRDGIPKASFVIYDSAASQITFVRLEYDIKLEQDRMKKAGLPDKLWQRLALGK